jgi:hypothetical protein
MRLLGSALGLLLVLAGPSACYQAHTTPRPVEEEMHAHLEAADRMRGAAVFGRGAEIRRAAQELASRGVVVGVPAGARRHIYDFRQRARELAETENLDEAVRTTPLLAWECGRCHVASRATPVTSLPSGSVPGGEGTERHAERLAWAVERLWDGVQGPSVVAWDLGIQALDDSASVAEGIQEGVRPVARPGEAADRLRALAWQGGQTGAAREQARLLGEIVLTCARCHTALRD